MLWPVQERLEHFDEKYLKPLLISDNLDSSLARLYDKLVLDEHYANLYGPAAAAETKKVDISSTGEVRKPRPARPGGGGEQSALGWDAGALHCFLPCQWLALFSLCDAYKLAELLASSVHDSD